MKITKELLEKTIKKSKSKMNTIKNLGMPVNGTSYKIIKEKIKEWNIDVSHFLPTWEQNRKYPLIEKTCPVCGKIFTTSKGSKNETFTCSYACSNTYFRSGENNPNWKENSYRTTCFVHHKKECIVCKENKIVHVHHFDGNKNNNNPENLIPLCPTHHQYWHSRYRELIKKDVIRYRNNFIKKNT